MQTAMNRAMHLEEAKGYMESLKRKNLRCGLKMALLNGDVNNVKRFHEAGVSFDVTDQLVYAVKSENRELCEYLLSKGARLDNGRTISFTPLHAAAITSAPMCQYLFDKGAPSDVVDALGKTPLVTAYEARCCNKDFETFKEVLEVLLSNGVNPRKRDDSNDTFLDFVYRMPFYRDRDYIVSKLRECC